MKQKSCEKVAEKFNCENCDYTTYKKSSYAKHLTTQKHECNKSSNFCNKIKGTELVCNNCKNIYNSRATLWRHKKACIAETDNYFNDETMIIQDSSSNTIVELLIKENSDFKTLILDLVKNNTELQKQNQEFQKQVLDVCQKIQPATINNTSTTTNNNKTFNLQFFLNEQCKDAMNVSEFVNSFQLNLEDLERVGRHGYVDGISHIILSKLKETDIYKRPFHCSDAKRETLYVKDANGWERESADNSKMIKAVKDVGQKNFPILNDYRLSHPDCIQADSVDNDKYVQMMIAAAGSQKDNVNKVIKKIAKEVVIDK